MTGSEVAVRPTVRTIDGGGLLPLPVSESTLQLEAFLRWTNDLRGWDALNAAPDEPGPAGVGCTDGATVCAELKTLDG
jgi:hypothetical protein